MVRIYGLIVSLMALLGFYEDPTLRLARLRSALDSQMQGLDDTVDKAVDLEDRRRAMEDSLRQFRQVERRQPSPFSRIPEEARPTPEQRRDRRGFTFPDPALRGTGVGDRQQRQLELFQRLITEGVGREEAQQRAFGGGTFTRGETVTPAGQLALTRGEDISSLGRFRDLQTTPAGTVPDVVGQLPAIAGAPQRFLDPVAALALQTVESPAGQGIPGVGALTSGQAAGGQAADVLGKITVPEAGEPGQQLQGLVDIAQFGARAAEATLPRERTFGEAFEGGAVNPIKAALGDEEEIAKAQAVLEEAGLPRALAAQLIFDPLNVIPGVGFTKVDDFARLLRLAAKARGPTRVRALAALKNSDVLKDIQRGGSALDVAGEATGVRFAGDETAAQLEDLRAGFTPRRAADETAFNNFIAKADPGPPPKEPPGAPPKEPPTGLSPDDPEFDDILDAAIKGEPPDQALMRRHQGVIDARASELAVEVTDNNKELVRIGLGQNFRGSVVAKTEGSFDELNSLLHNPGAVARGERVVPDELRPIYDKLRTQTDFEQAARVDFDPNQALVEDYFFRGWKPPEGLFTGPQRGALGRNPSFKLPRVDATYDEMFEAGFRPMFENPAEQARHSQLMGVKYREQMRLIEKMRASEIALPVKGGPIPEGWRVPEVGPAFQGKPYANGADVAYTRQWAVLDSMANRLENIYGKMPKLGKGEIFGKTVDFQKMVDFLTFVPKRAKLVGSVFQHLDFLSRSGFGAWTGFVDALRRGQPIDAVTHLAKWPKSAVDIVHSTFSPGFRARLAKLGVDPKPLWKDRGISNLMLREEGLSLRDPTLGIDLDDVIRQVKQEPKIIKLGKAPIRALDALERQWRQGLFQGTYPAAILSDVKNNIGPMVIRQHPEATDRQLAGMIAKAANKLYSVVPESQSVIQNKQARWFLTRFLFSLGENEGLLRSFTGAIRGENAALFRTRLVGTYLGLMFLASTIHFASTGKPLPLDRFQPVSKDKFGPLPFGYNTDFAAPTLPIKGRGDTEITLDLVMQQDTIFRILDPKSFLNARFSVPVSTARNQITGTDFFGAPIDTVGPGGIFSRTSRLVQDMFAPIGAGQAGLEIFRNNVEESEGLITPGEGRLGTAGLGIQAGGINLRAERTPELVDRIRGEVLRDRGIEKSYEEIATTDLPLKAEIDTEVDERIGAELEIRGETVKIRGQQTPQSEGFEALEATRERQQVEQLADDTKLNSNQWSGDVWREKYADRQRGFFASREQIKEDFGITFDERKSPSKSVNAAIDAYFDVNIDDGTFNLPDGTIDWDKFFDARDAALKPLSATDRKRVVEWLRKFDTPTVTEFRKAKDVVNKLFETPKYKSLTLKEGEELDEFVNVSVGDFQRDFLRRTGRELSRVVATILAAKEFGISSKVLRFAMLFRKRKVRDVFLDPRRDEILQSNQVILAKFYPSLLEQQLSREEEAALSDEAFAGITR